MRTSAIACTAHCRFACFPLDCSNPAVKGNPPRATPLVVSLAWFYSGLRDLQRSGKQREDLDDRPQMTCFRNALAGVLCCAIHAKEDFHRILVVCNSCSFFL